MKHKAIFFDRDGVINTEVDYLHKIEDCKFVPTVFDAVRQAENHGYKRIIVTNQAGIAKGKYTQDDFYTLMNWMLRQFDAHNTAFNGIYHSPYHPKGTVTEFARESPCRKPGIGMLEQAASEHDIDLAQSWIIGDKTSDILAGKNAGCKTVLVETGYGGSDNLHDVQPDYKATDVLHAVQLITDRQ